MRILHVAALNMDPSAGPTYSVPSFVKAQNDLQGIVSHLFNSSSEENNKEQFYYKNSFKTRNAFVEFLKSYDIVVFHSTYIVEHVKIAAVLRKVHVPYVIVPRGGFTKGAKNIKKWKKKIGDILLFRKFFHSANSIHFLTEAEKDQSVHKTKLDFVLPNGINIPFIKKSVFNGNGIKIVYIGRLDIYHKGLDLLAGAVALIKTELEKENVKIDLYGPDVRGSEQKLIHLIEEYEIGNIMQINKPVFLEEKIKILLDSDVFIQASRFEGLPMGILEALSLGLPCILTPGTNLSKEVVKFEAGLEVMEDPKSISNGILNMINKLKSESAELNKNAVHLASMYSWENIARKSIYKYSNIIEF